MASNTNNWQQIADTLPKVTSQAVRKTALDAEGNIKAHIVANDQVDTGFMLGSVYVVTSDFSDYSGGPRALPEVAAPTDEQTACVAVAAEYAVFPNYGTVNQVGNAFFEPGMDEARIALDAAVALIAKKLGEV